MAMEGFYISIITFLDSIFIGLLIFFWIKIKLSCHMFTQIGWIILSVVIMTLLNTLNKKVLDYITEKWHI